MPLQERSGQIKNRNFWAPALVMLILIWGGTIGLAFQEFGQASLRNQVRFNEAIAIAQAEIDSRLEVAIGVLSASAAFVNVQSNLAATDFNNFVSHLDLRSKYPGFQGLGYAERISASGLEEYQKSVRERDHRDFNVRSDSIRGDLYPIRFLEPFDETNASVLGYDMFSDATRRIAMSVARDTGIPAASATLQLKQEVTAERQNGFLIYVALYNGAHDTIERRKAAVTGFVYGAFRAGDFFSSLAPHLKALNLTIAVSDPVNREISPLFMSPGWTADGDIATRDISFAQQTFLVQYNNTASSPLFNFATMTILAIGLSLGSLVSWLTFREIKILAAASSGNLERVRLADALDLHSTATNVTRAPIMLTDMDGRIRTWNKGCEQLYGYSSAEATGQINHQLLKTVFPDERESLIESILRDGKLSCEVIQTGKTGDLIEVESRFELIRRPSGPLLLNTDWDVRERKRAERRDHMLVSEMTHRVKNQLAVVQSIIGNSLKEVSSIGELKPILMGRIQALSTAQHYVTLSNENGALISRIIESQAAPWGSRIEWTGDNFSANSSFVQMFSLVIHELLTSSISRGALSVEEGHVAIAWSVGTHDGFPGTLMFTWTETGSNSIRPADAGGLGDRLIKTALPSVSDDWPKFDDLSDGFRFTALIPVSHAIIREETLY